MQERREQLLQELRKAEQARDLLNGLERLLLISAEIAKRRW
jgi:hypothetical protein